VPYIAPFDKVTGLLTLTTIKGQLTASASYDEFQTMIRTLLLGIEVDEDWYRREYPDVADAIAAGTVASAKTHFLNDGYFEGRLPFPLVVDETFYLAEYPEVAEAVGRGAIASAQQHFDVYGYSEGRLPRPL
jgi:hypothetical protein